MQLETPSGRVQRIAASSFWIAADTALGFASAFITSILVARLLGPEKLGYYSYIIWLTNIAGSLGALGVPMATRKYLAEFLGTGNMAISQAILSMTFRFQASMAALIVIAGLTVVHTAVPPQHRVYSTLAVLSLFPAMVMAIASAANIAVEDFGANVRPSLVSTIVGLIGVALSLAFRWDLVGLAASLLVSRIVDFVLRLWLFEKRFGSDWRRSSLESSAEQKQQIKDLKNRMWRFCMQSSVLQLLTVIVWDRSEMLFLERFRTARDVAFYSISFNISQHLLLLPRIFATAAGANLLATAGQEGDRANGVARSTIRYLALVAFPLTFGIAALSDPVVRLLYGAQYIPAIPVLAILGVFSSAKVLVFPAQQLIIAADRQDILVKLTVLIAVVNITLDFWLIPGYGPVGAAIANSISQTAAMIAIWIAAARSVHLRAPGKDLLRLMGATGAMAMVAAAIASVLPPLTAVAAGATAGAVLFCVFLRWSGALDSTDRQRLLAMQHRLPGGLRNIYRKSVQFVAAA